MTNEQKTADIGELSTWASWNLKRLPLSMDAPRWRAIVALEAENKALRDALEPFAECGRAVMLTGGKSPQISGPSLDTHLERARVALADALERPKLDVRKLITDVESGKRDGFLDKDVSEGTDVDLACPQCGGSGHKDDVAIIEVEPFQQRVQPWMMECFGAEISADRLERGDRFIEEALELLQSGGYPRERIRALIDYVYGRDIGEPEQEVGGVMVTLAAYCLAHDIDMHECGETELARVWTKVEKIRAKQAAKPTGSALPVASPPAPVVTEEAESFRRMCRENYDAFTAMRNDINEIIGDMSSQESALLDGPEMAHECTAVVDAVSSFAAKTLRYRELLTSAYHFIKDAHEPSDDAEFALVSRLEAALASMEAT